MTERSGARQFGTPTDRFCHGDYRSLCPPGHQEQLFWTSLGKHEQMKSYLKLWKNTITGWPAVDKRFISGTTAVLRSWLLTSEMTLVCLCKPFLCKAYSIIKCICVYLHNMSSPEPGHTTGESIRAAYGGTAGPGGTGSTGRRRDCSRRRKQPLLPSRRWEHDLLGVSLEARTIETLFKPMEE